MQNIKKSSGMDDAELTVSNRNEILSQSYSQGLERIGCKDNTSEDFELPAGLIRMRKEQWDEFFRRYDKELEDDLEIDMRADYGEEEENQRAEGNSGEESDFELRQLDSDVEESDEESDEDEEAEEEEEGEEEGEYFEKNRAPLRKTPSLIQYWIDTGRPPILMTEEPDAFNELLGEEANPKSDKLVNSMEVEAKRPSNSVFSSVDTAAYILSNTNVTAKAETLAIVEGAKSLDLNDINVNGDAEVPGCLGNEINCDIRNKSSVKNNSPKKNQSPIKNIKALEVNSTSIEESQTLDNIIQTKKKLDLNNSSSNINNNNDDNSLSQLKISHQNSNPASHNNNNIKLRLNNNPIAQCSPKIADILPMHDDPTKAKVIESSNISKEYDGIDSLQSLKLNDNNIYSNIIIDTTTNNGRKSMRKKLYTQRNSPVAFLPTTPISVNSKCNDSDYFNTSNVEINYQSKENKLLGQLHPAFATPASKKPKVKRRKRASWARRMSRYSKVNKLDAVNSSDDEANEGKNYSNSPDKNKSTDGQNKSVNEDKKNSNKSSGKKRLIKAKKIRIPVRQSLRPKEVINYNEYLSDEEKPANKSKDKLSDIIIERDKALEKAKNEETLDKNEEAVVGKEKIVEALDILKMCKKLTVNIEPLPDNYLKLKNTSLSEIQNIEDSQESDVSTILMYECASNSKDVNTDTETGTEISRHESEDDKLQKTGMKPVQCSKTPFVQRCLGSLSDKNLSKTNTTGLSDKIKLIDNDTDDDSEAITAQSLTTKRSPEKSMNKSSTKKRIVSLSSDEEDDFSKLLNKNKSQSKLSVTKSDTSKNCDNLINNLTLESKVHVSSLLSVPTAVLRIVGNSDDENVITQNDLSIKRSVSTRQKKSPKINKNKSKLEVLDKRKGKLNSVESETEKEVPLSIPKKVGESNSFIDKSIVNDNRDNVPLGLKSVDNSELSRDSKTQNKVQETKNLKKTSKNSKVNSNNDGQKSSKRRSKIEVESDSCDAILVSPPKKIKTSDNVNPEVLEPSSSINLDYKNSEKIINKSKNLRSCSNRITKSKELAPSPSNDLKSELKTPIKKTTRNSIFNSNSVKKRVSFAVTNIRKMLMSDSDDSPDDSLLDSSRFANMSFNTINNTDFVKKSSTPRITFSSSGLKSSLSLANKKNFYSTFVGDSDDSND